MVVSFERGWTHQTARDLGGGGGGGAETKCEGSLAWLLLPTAACMVEIPQVHVLLGIEAKYTNTSECQMAWHLKNNGLDNVGNVDVSVPNEALNL